jgi:hypothetical protein
MAPWNAVIPGGMPFAAIRRTACVSTSTCQDCRVVGDCSPDVPARDGDSGRFDTDSHGLADLIRPRIDPDQPTGVEGRLGCFLTSRQGDRECRRKRGEQGDRRHGEPAPAQGLGLCRHLERLASLRDELAAARVAVGRVLRESSLEHRVDRRGELRIPLARRRRRVVHVAPEDRDERVAAEGRRSGQALEQNAREPVLVGPRVDRLPGDLLGRRIGGCAREARGLVGAGRRTHGRQSKVGQIDVLGWIGVRINGDQEVGRLDVAVDETASMRGIERLRDSPKMRDGTRRLELPLVGEDPPQIGPLDVAHRDVEMLVRLTRLVDRDDVWMVEARRDLRLVEEPLAKALVLGQVGCEELESYPPAEARIEREIDVRRCATAEQSFDPVAGELRPDAQICPDRHEAEHKGRPPAGKTSQNPGADTLRAWR